MSDLIDRAPGDDVVPDTIDLRAQRVAAGTQPRVTRQARAVLQHHPVEWRRNW